MSNLPPYCFEITILPLYYFEITNLPPKKIESYSHFRSLHNHLHIVILPCIFVPYAFPHWIWSFSHSFYQYLAVAVAVAVAITMKLGDQFDSLSKIIRLWIFAYCDISTLPPKEWKFIIRGHKSDSDRDCFFEVECSCLVR